MKIALASDHGGYRLKEEIFSYLIEKGYSVQNLGTNSLESCDYPFFAKKVCELILENKAEKGILICGTGVGMSIVANRFKGIRAACVSDTYSAKMTRAHNDSNVLCMGERVVGVGLAKEIVDVWLDGRFEKGRHQKRIDLID